jgi:hypothetical protein
MKPPDILEVRILNLRDLKGAPYNPREITPEALDGLTASLRRFGLVEPVVWNKRTRRVVGGHQRIEALRRLKIKRVQAVVVDLSEAEERALNLTLNNPATAGRFTAAVRDVLGEIELASPEMSRELRLPEIRVDEIEARRDRPRFSKIAIPKPPKKVWVLLGIDASKYQEVAGRVEELQKLEGIDAHVKVE